MTELDPLPPADHLDLLATIDMLKHELAMIRLLARGAGRGRDRATLDSIVFSVTQAIGTDDPPSMGGWADYKATFHRPEDQGKFLPALTLGYHLEKIRIHDAGKDSLNRTLSVADLLALIQTLKPKQIKRAHQALERAQARIAFDNPKVTA